MLSSMWGGSMFTDSESPGAYGDSEAANYGGLEFGTPSYMGDMGAPGMTDAGHAMKPPFQTQPIHMFRPEYAAPGFTDQGHAMKPPFQTQPIHQFQPQYASPGFTDQGHVMRPPFQTQPIHQFPTYGAASPTIAPGVYKIKSNRRTFSVSSTGTIAGQDQMGLSIGSASPGEALWTGWVGEIQAAKASGDLETYKSQGGGILQSAADALSAFASGIGAKFEPSGEATPAANTGAGSKEEEKKTDWGKVALWSAAGLAGVGLIWWGISAMNKD